MADVWVLLLILAFFALCVAFVRGCDVIIGPDDAQELEPPEPEPPDRDRVFRHQGAGMGCRERNRDRRVLCP